MRRFEILRQRHQNAISRGKESSGSRSTTVCYEESGENRGSGYQVKDRALFCRLFFVFDSLGGQGWLPQLPSCLRRGGRRPGVGEDGVFLPVVESKRGLKYTDPAGIPISPGGEIEDEAIDSSHEPDKAEAKTAE